MPITNGASVSTGPPGGIPGDAQLDAAAAIANAIRLRRIG
jgi:hypothetical protein